MHAAQCNPDKGFLLNHEINAVIATKLPPFLRGNSLEVRVAETEKDVTVSVVIPGVTKEELGVYAAEDYVRITREITHSDNYRNEYMFKFEHYETSFTRIIPLTTKVQSRQARGEFRSEVLTVWVPKIS